MYRDQPLDQLRDYAGQVSEPADFDEFWGATLGEARACPGSVTLLPVETPLSTIDVYDVGFPGFAGQPIRAWLRVPRGLAAPAPVVVGFVGYGGGRGYATAELFWASAGYVHFQMDTRGQGGELERR